MIASQLANDTNLSIMTYTLSTATGTSPFLPWFHPPRVPSKASGLSHRFADIVVQVFDLRVPLTHPTGHGGHGAVSSGTVKRRS